MTQQAVNKSQLATQTRLWRGLRSVVAVACNPETGAQQDIQHTFGSPELAASMSWPRIIWVPSVDIYNPKMARTAENPRNRLPVREITKRMLGVDLYLHGEDTDMVEYMLYDVLNACYQVFGPQTDIQNGQWVSQRDNEWLKDGEAYMLHLGIHTPVPRLPLDCGPAGSGNAGRYVTLESIEGDCPGEMPIPKPTERQ